MQMVSKGDHLHELPIFAWNVKTCFLGKIRKILQNVVCREISQSAKRYVHRLYIAFTLKGFIVMVTVISFGNLVTGKIFRYNFRNSLVLFTNILCFSSLQLTAFNLKSYVPLIIWRKCHVFCLFYLLIRWFIYLLCKKKNQQVNALAPVTTAADDILNVIKYFHRENKTWHFVWSPSADDLDETVILFLSEKKIQKINQNVVYYICD